MQAPVVFLALPPFFGEHLPLLHPLQLQRESRTQARLECSTTLVKPVGLPPRTLVGTAGKQSFSSSFLDPSKAITGERLPENEANQEESRTERRGRLLAALLESLIQPGLNAASGILVAWPHSVAQVGWS